MRHLLVLGAALVLSLQAHAAKVIWVYFPNSDISWIYGLNDDNAVAGTYYMRDRTVHGFYGPAGGPYHDFQFAGASTGARAIDNKGNIVGVSHFWDGEKYCDYVPFERTPDGKIGQIAHGDTKLGGFVNGMVLSSGAFVGDTCDAHRDSVGYRGRNARWRTDLDIPIPGAQPRGVNKAGTVVGQFKGDDKHWHGFILKDGTAGIVDFPGAKRTQLSGINDAGIAVGIYYPHGYHYRPFSLDTNTNVFTDIRFNRHQYGEAFATAINNKGYTTINVGNGRGYVLCPEGADCPGGQDIKVETRRVTAGRFPVWRPR
ncbi:MAG TPA: hypothetical protein VG889_10650 [Rhizomicrobium sp.]|nr:hypothetical protein [Rhizomicrobium sp.]